MRVRTLYERLYVVVRMYVKSGVAVPKRAAGYTLCAYVSNARRRSCRLDEIDYISPALECLLKKLQYLLSNSCYQERLNQFLFLTWHSSNASYKVSLNSLDMLCKTVPWVDTPNFKIFTHFKMVFKILRVKLHKNLRPNEIYRSTVCFKCRCNFKNILFIQIG